MAKVVGTILILQRLSKTTKKRFLTIVVVTRLLWTKLPNYFVGGFQYLVYNVSPQLPINKLADFCIAAESLKLILELLSHQLIYFVSGVH